VEREKIFWRMDFFLGGCLGAAAADGGAGGDADDAAFGLEDFPAIVVMII